MAFEKLAPHIDFIEESFIKKKSPRAIAKELGNPGLYQTIARYKAAVWDIRDLVSEAKEERAKRHDSAREAAKVEIVKSLDLIEKMKSRAFTDMDWMPGDEYTVTKEDGTEGVRRVSPGQAIAWHHQACDMAAKALKAELELAGDDPESRKASALEGWNEADLRAILEAINATEATDA
jgi:hypothetical protein